MGRSTRPLGIITAAIGLWIAVMVTISVSAAPQQNVAAPGKAAPAAPKAAAASGYVGEDTCLTCHENKKKGYHGSPHSRATDPRTPAAKQGCESCHGPGQAHVDGGGDKTKITNPTVLAPRQVSALCTTCHNRGEHANWKGSAHDSRNITCTTCHSIHEYTSETGQLKAATQLDTCAQCHRDKVQKLNRSGHMPVREGKMVCMSCHNVHGSENVKLLRVGTSVNESCTSCHTEKRGPFLWEHAPVRENCATCHDPHGSNNDRMLVAKQPMLCQRCHISTRHPPTVYDAAQVRNGSNRVISRSCVNCHQQIHGSNSPSGQRFAR